MMRLYPTPFIGMLVLIFISVYSYAMNEVLCPICFAVHDEKGKDATEADSVVVIDNQFCTLVAETFPCLSEAIAKLDTMECVPDCKVPNASHAINPMYAFPIFKEHVIALCFLTLINKNNEKNALPEHLLDLLKEKNYWHDYTKKWLGWRAFAVIIIFAMIPALSNFFSLINIPDSNNTTSSGSNTVASQLTQESLIALFAFSFGALGNGTSLIWSGRNPDTLRDKTVELLLEAAEVEENFMQLCRSLLILNHYFPALARQFAKEIQMELIRNRMTLTTPELSLQLERAWQNLCGAVDFIKSRGKSMPTNGSLLDLITVLRLIAVPLHAHGGLDPKSTL